MKEIVITATFLMFLQGVIHCIKYDYGFLEFMLLPLIGAGMGFGVGILLVSLIKIGNYLKERFYK